jgi:glucosamine-phosphate N-acetyltransferase
MKGLVIRDMYGPDISDEFQEILEFLSVADFDMEEAGEILRDRLKHGVRTYVALLDGKVVGTTSLFIERKFLHGGGRTGHIEDVVVHGAFQKRGIGSALVKHAVQEAKKAGCYKVILDCNLDKEHFYSNLGFQRRAIQMRIDLH